MKYSLAVKENEVLNEPIWKNTNAHTIPVCKAGCHVCKKRSQEIKYVYMTYA